jgi:GT2 family glycosyltransferase
MTIRREAFKHVGLFDERLGAGTSGCSEDSEFWYRVLAEGWTCRYDPTVVVYHYHRREMESLRQQAYLYMRGHVTALFVQYERYGHWGNLKRIFWVLPRHYARVFFRIRGRTWSKRMLIDQIRGCVAGLFYYLGHRKQTPGDSSPKEF